MSEFVWQAHYLLGDEAVDHQHQQLFDLANKLVESKSNPELIENIMRLYRHTSDHFKVEEDFMKLRGYPAYKNHIETHNMMLDKLVAVSDKIRLQQWQQADVLKFMREWIGHILEEDSAVNHYIQSQTNNN